MEMVPATDPRTEQSEADEPDPVGDCSDCDVDFHESVYADDQ